MVDRRIIFFADVTILRLDDFAEIGIVRNFLLLNIFWWQNVRCGENFFAAQFADASLVQLGFVELNFLGFAPPNFCLHQAATLVHVGTINRARCREQSRPLRFRKFREQCAVAHGLFQNLGGGLQLRGDFSGIAVVVLMGGHYLAQRIAPVLLTGE